MQPSVNELNFTSEVLARSHHAAILVNFGAPWCGLCKMLQPLIDQFGPEWDGQMESVYINADENLKLCSSYRIQALPTLLLIVDGEVVRKYDRFHDRDDLRRTLASIAIPKKRVSA
jgi:thioredoxin 1